MRRPVSLGSRRNGKGLRKRRTLLVKCQTEAMKECRISVRLNSALRQRLEAAAVRTGKRESSLVREALERQLSRSEAGETAYDLALRAGLIGAVKRGSRDLSTNPRHFDGFGES